MRFFGVSEVVIDDSVLLCLGCCFCVEGIEIMVFDYLGIEGLLIEILMFVFFKMIER